MPYKQQLGPVLRPHDQAPQIAVVDSSGQLHHLAELWAAQPLVLVFLRHFG